MRLIELELTNIKSYKHEIINFHEGINCILGLNGSGKSTIIESIGSVLFNFNQRSSNSLLRYNERKGQISLLFEGNDDKLYRIIKTFRLNSNTSIKIIDEENKQVLQEISSDVYAFVKQVLNIPKEKRLSKMFEEIIAVPQGTFVNAFLETPRNRKENFDKLFELDIYKKLADEMKVLSDTVQKDYIFKIEKEIASIDGRLVDYDLKIENQNKLILELKDQKEIFEKTSDIYNKKKNEKEQAERIYNHLIEAKTKKEVCEKEISNINNQIKIYKENLELSKEAQKQLYDNEFGYKLYVKTNEELKNNEVIYNHYIDLNNDLNNNKSEITKLNESNKYINEIIKDKKIELGILKQQNIDKNNVIKENKTKIQTIEQEIKPLKQAIFQKEQLKTDTQAKYTFYLNKLNTIRTYILSVNFNDNIEKNDTKVKEIEQKLQKININKNQITELEKEKIKVVSDLNNLNSNYSYINDGLCPILKQKCLNISGSTLTSEIQKIIDNKNNEIQNINSKINVLLIENKEEEALVKERELLLFDINNTIRQKDKYISVIEDLQSTFEHENLKITKENDKEIILNLIKKYEELKNNYNDDVLNTLKAEEIKFTNNIYSLINQNNISENIINENSKKINDISLEIVKKERELQENLVKIKEYEGKNSLIILKLNQVDDIKGKIEENKKVLEKYFTNYNVYISKQSEAQSFEKYQKLVDENEKKVINIVKELDQININIETLSKQVSKEQVDTLISEVNQSNNDLAVLNNTINIMSNQLEVLIGEIKILDGYIKEKENKQKLLQNYIVLDDKFKLYRAIFNNLPKELSKQIRKYISIYASSLYRKISNENVRIDILDDYEVIVIDCIDKTKQKSLSQLSGGEQMSVAIAIRLAMLKQITNVDLYFMDEPTINLDYERRMMVGEVVKDISNELKQLFVISHDDTFESITDNNIKIEKINNISVLDN